MTDQVEKTGDVRLTTVAAYERKARQILAPEVFGVFHGEYGSPDWEALTNNIDGFRRLYLRPRVLRDTRAASTQTTLLGEPVSSPIMVAPMGHQQRYHLDGEAATAIGASRAGCLTVLATPSSYSIEEVADASDGPLWFQLYFQKNRKLNEILLKRAEDCGYKAIVLTVSNPGIRERYREDTFNYSILGNPDDTHVSDHMTAERYLRNFADLHDVPGCPTLDTFHDQFDDSLGWPDIEYLRGLTSLPIVVKGIQTAEDAVLAAQYGVDGLVVSNHGDHSLQGARGTVDSLPEVVEAVGEKCEVYLDGGVRRGTDVLKCIALGARGVLIGRPTLWALTIGGADGVERLYNLLNTELHDAMRFCGLTDLSEAIPSAVGAHNGCGIYERNP